MSKINLGDKLFHIYGGQLEMFRFHLQKELHAYQKFILDAQEKITEESEKLEKQIAEKIKAGVDADYAHHLHEMDDMVLFSMPNIHRKSQLISLFAFMESHMKILCDYVAQDKKMTLKITDLSGSNYIEQGKVYLSKVLDVKLGDLNDFWPPINHYKAIRNCITHRNSNFKLNNKTNEEQPLYKSLDYFGIDKFKIYSFGEFSIESTDFLIKFCEFQWDFFDKLTERIDDVCYSNKK